LHYGCRSVATALQTFVMDKIKVPLPHYALYVLNGVRLEKAQVAIEIERRKAIALLIYLALTGTRHARNLLIDLFWSDYPPERAAANLRRVLSTIRTHLGPHFLETDRDTVAIHPATVLWVDALEVRHLAQQVQKGVDPDPTPQIVEATLNWYQHQVLEGWYLEDSPRFEIWRQQQIERGRQALATLCTRLIAAYQQMGRLQEALRTAERWVALDPLQEPAHQALIALYLRTDQRAAALRQYETCIAILREEYDSPPSEATRGLYHALQAQELSHPPLELKESFALLPRPATMLTGRTTEMTSIRALLLEEPDCRLLTLVGPGGIGKSHLALYAAHELQSHFQDGAVLVALAGCAEGQAVPSIVAEALGLPLGGRETVWRQIFAYLAARHLVLLVDNIEHVMETVFFLQEIIRYAPHVKILVTSRERLTVPEAWTLDVHGLQIPPSLDPPDPRQYSAVVLFLQRVRQIHARFTLTPENSLAICQITRTVAGNPLALELAAAWARLLPIPTIADQVAQSYDFLSDTLRQLPARHRSLRAVFEQSWSLLSTLEQEACIGLSVFRGNFDGGAAEAVAQVTLPLLLTLSDKSLLQWDEDGTFHLHESIREFTVEKAKERGDTFALNQRHAEYYLRYLQQTKPKPRYPTPLLQAVDNIRLAWHWVVNTGQVHWIANTMDAWHQLIRYQSWYQEGRDSFGAASRCFPNDEGEDAVTLSFLLSYQAECCAYLGEYRDAEDLARRSITCVQRASAAAALGRAMGVKGAVAYLTGRLGDAYPLLHESLAYLEKSDDTHGTARTLFFLGITTRKLGKYQEAQLVFERALTLYQGLDDPMGMAEVQNSLGLLYYRRLQPARAEMLFNTCLVTWRQMGDRRGVAAILNNLGMLAYEKGEFGRALDLFQTSADECVALGTPRGVALALANVGEVALHQGRYDDAHVAFQKSIEIYQTLGDRGGSAEPAIGIGVAYWCQEQWKDAETQLRACLEMLHTENAPTERMNALCHLALALMEQGCIVEATSCLQQAGVLLGTESHPRREIRLQLTHAWMAHYLGQAALPYVQEARRLATSLHILPLQMEIDALYIVLGLSRATIEEQTVLMHHPGVPAFLRARLQLLLK
jgi:predicted ATPase/DNA-binding SARP family transcriptional activator